MKNIIVINILISIGLLLLPSINLGFIYTHGIGKLLIIISFCFLIWHLFYNSLQHSYTFEHITIVIYVLATSLSVLAAVDITSFVSRYITFLVPIMTYFILVILNDYKKLHHHIFYTIALVFFLNLFFQIGLVLLPQESIAILRYFLHPMHIEYLVVNLQRDRIYFPAYSESILPIILFVAIQKEHYSTRFVYFIAIFIQTIISIYGKFRSMFIMLIISYVGSIFTLKSKRIFVPILFIITITSILSILLYYFSYYTVFDRLIIQNENDYQTVISRIDQIPESMQILSTRIFGVGLGNYLYNLPNHFFASIPIDSFVYQTDQMPHNIFLEKSVETGIIGVVAYTLMLVVFIYKDIKCYFYQKDQFKKICIVSFWSLFSYAFFNPSYNITFNMLFFVFRALLR